MIYFPIFVAFIIIYYQKSLIFKGFKHLFINIFLKTMNFAYFLEFCHFSSFFIPNETSLSSVLINLISNYLFSFSLGIITNLYICTIYYLLNTAKCSLFIHSIILQYRCFIYNLVKSYKYQSIFNINIISIVNISINFHTNINTILIIKVF